MKTKTTFNQLYGFPGFRARARFKSGIKGNSNARVVELVRRKKKLFVPYANGLYTAITTKEYTGYVICLLGRCRYTWNSNTGVGTVRSVA